MINDRTPNFASHVGLPSYDSLQYVRALTWLAVAIIVLLYVTAVTMRSPRNMRKILKRRVGA